MDIIRVKQGELKGKLQQTENGFQYRSFQGIPYAKPPLNDLRFKEAQPPEPWAGVRDATAEGGVCPQMNEQTGEVEGDEDCLFLNVYTPQMSNNSTDKVPVMVWVHGGGFFKGSGNYALYGPDYFLEKNVVFVNVNYRFGVFGFLCLHSADVPGNAGLKDIISALKWIKENIVHFGGDPDNVTLFGESAGAASISYLSLCPSAKGLFHKMAIQSGTSLCPWAVQSDPLKYARKISDKFGVTQIDNRSMLHSLQTIPYKDLTREACKILDAEDDNKYLPIAFLPVVEKSFPRVESVITENPVNIIKSGKMLDVPTITGFSSKEGLLLFGKINFDWNKCHTLIHDLKLFLPPSLTRNEKTANCVSKFEDVYFDRKPVDISQLNNVIDFISDYLFRHPINRNVILHTEHSAAPIYYFQFSYQGNLSRDKKIFSELKMEGASHSEECGYMFKKERFQDATPTAADIQTRERLVTMWTNFSKTGNPTPDTNDLIPVAWPAATKNNLTYLEINKDIAVETYPNAKALQLWMDIQHMCETD